MEKQDKTTVLLIGQDVRRVNRKMVTTCMSSGDNFENKQLHAGKRNVSIINSGARKYFFDPTLVADDPLVVMGCPNTIRLNWRCF